MTRTTRTTQHGRRALAAACGLALVLVPAHAAQARLGDLDPGFGADGIATPAVGPVGPAGAGLEGIAPRPDGRIVAAGWATNPSGLAEPLVVQLTSGGAADPGFGATGPGFTRIPTGAVQTRLHDVALDAGGRVLAAGEQAATTLTPRAFRFDANGAPDTSFAGVIGGTRGEGRAIAALPDGSTLMAGWRGATESAEGFFVAKLTAAGALDQGFGANGVADVPLGSLSRGEDVAVDPAGRIIVAGWRSIPLGGGTVEQPVLVRLTPTGAPDPTFGSGGILDAAAANPDGAAVGRLHAVGIDGAGRIVAAGSSGRHAFVTRRLDDGGPDPAFGTNGATFGTLPGSAALGALALDGARAVVAGQAAGTAPEQVLLASLSADGAPEPALGGAPPGWRTFAIASRSAALDAAIGPAGTVYTAGGLATPSRPFVARHLANAAPAAALAAAAQATAGVPMTFDAAGSSDPEGEPLRFDFDLDGDGTFELAGGGNPLALRSFPAPGTYTVGVRVTDPRGASATAARTVAVGPARVAPPRPVLGEQGVARPLRGIVRIRLPGTRRFVRITELTAIPNGTEIDTREGRVLLTVVRDAGGGLDGGRFHGGRFIFRQGKGKRPITTLRLSGGGFGACRAEPARLRAGLVVAAAASAPAASAAGRKKPVRRLWGDGRGRFRTRGRYGAATVRGTKWLTRDRCGGTLVRVVRGKVAVRDLVRPGRRLQLVERGERVVIRPRSGR